MGMTGQAIIDFQIILGQPLQKIENRLLSLLKFLDVLLQLGDVLLQPVDVGIQLSQPENSAYTRRNDRGHYDNHRCRDSCYLDPLIQHR